MIRPLSSLLVVALLAAGLVGVESCASENLQDLSGADVLPCDTTVLATYALQVQPIIDKYGCAGAACHSPGGQGLAVTGFNYQTAAGFQAAARSGQLLGALERRTGFSPMPKNQDRISDCDLATIKRWIRLGAKND